MLIDKEPSKGMGEREARLALVFEKSQSENDQMMNEISSHVPHPEANA